MGETDLISRQAAIDAVMKYCLQYDLRDLLAELEVMPSVQPEKACVAEIKVDGEELQRCVDRAVERLKKEEQPKTPCDLCRHNPPSSGDSKPCSYCPAEGEWG